MSHLPFFFGMGPTWGVGVIQERQIPKLMDQDKVS